MKNQVAFRWGRREFRRETPLGLVLCDEVVGL